MAALSTNTTTTNTNATPLSARKAAAAAVVARILAALRPTPRTPEQRLTAERERFEARVRVDTLLR